MSTEPSLHMRACANTAWGPPDGEEDKGSMQWKQQPGRVPGRRRLEQFGMVAVTALVVYSLSKCSSFTGRLITGQQLPAFSYGDAGGAAAVLGSLALEKAAFLQQHAAAYGYSGWIDRHWKTQVGDKLGPKLHHYLDFTAAALFTRSHLAQVTQLLGSNTLSNPHSRNPSSARSTQELRDAEQLVLQFFNADPSEYMVVWSMSASHALKMVGEFFPWSGREDWQPQRSVPPGPLSNAEVGPVSSCGRVPASASAAGQPPSSHFLYLQSNHKSVLGIGSYAADHGAAAACVDEEGMADWLSSSSSGGDAEPAADAAAGGGVTYSLVGYPSKDNYEGRLYPLEWIEKIQAKSTLKHRWLVVLDSAAFVATHPLDLSAVHPDFVPISFYKMFGFPTGLGCLIMRREAASLLHKVYFGGGAVDEATAEDLWRVISDGPDGFQDGTKNFLGIPLLQFGFKQISELGGMKAVEAHVASLQAWTYAALCRLKHSNGRPMVKLFGRHSSPQQQSCIFEMLLLSPEGAVVSPVHVEQASAAAGLAIRTGCMCNPGACNRDLGIRPEEKRAAVLARANMSSGFMEVMRPAAAAAPGAASVRLLLPTGSVRVSLGYLSTFEDCYAAIKFFQTYRDVPGSPELTNIASLQAAGSSSGAASTAATRPAQLPAGKPHQQAQAAGVSQRSKQPVRIGRLPLPQA